MLVAAPRRAHCARRFQRHSLSRRALRFSIARAADDHVLCHHLRTHGASSSFPVRRHYLPCIRRCSSMRLQRANPLMAVASGAASAPDARALRAPRCPVSDGPLGLPTLFTCSCWRCPIVVITTGTTLIVYLAAVSHTEQFCLARSCAAAHALWCCNFGDARSMSLLCV